MSVFFLSKCLLWSVSLYTSLFSVYLSFCVSVSLYVYLLHWLFVCYFSEHLSVCVSASLYVYLIHCLLVCYFVCGCVFFLTICLYVSLPVFFFCLFVCRLVRPSVCAQVWCCCVVQKQNKNHPKGSIKISPPHYI